MSTIYLLYLQQPGEGVQQLANAVFTLNNLLPLDRLTSVITVGYH